MKTPPPAPVERSRRKQDLLLASSLARQQAMVAIDQISHRADVVVGSYQQIRAWMAVPHVGAVAGLGASVATLLALRRVRGVGLLRWGLLGWRVWKLTRELLPVWRSTR